MQDGSGFQIDEGSDAETDGELQCDLEFSDTRYKTKVRPGKI